MDVMLLTSVREAQPLVILEAFSVGIMVVATRVGNVPELLDYDDRFLVSSKDAAKLAEGVRYIYEHPDEIQNLIKKNKEKIFNFYDRKVIYNKYLNLYRSLGTA